MQLAAYENQTKGEFFNHLADKTIPTNTANLIFQQLLNDVRKKSEYIFDELQTAEGVESVTGMGLMIGIKTIKPAGEVVKECMEKGVLCLTAKDKVRLLPPLNIPMPLLKEAIDTIKSSLE